MSRFLSPPVATGALAITVAVLALLAAGCGNSGGHAAATTSTTSSQAPCTLDKAQRHTVAMALADIRRLRRIQAPVQTFSQEGAPMQNEVTGKFMLDVGATKLPPNVYAHLIHLAKSAVTLCGACSQGLEADEPFLGTRGKQRCG